MLPGAHVNALLEHAPQELRDIVLELRSMIVQAAPHATEVARWRGLVYYDASRGGPVSAGICVIRVHDGEVRLGFIHGWALPDPDRLLKSEGGRKAKRFVRLSLYEQVPWEAIERLIAAAASFDPKMANPPWSNA